MSRAAHDWLARTAIGVFPFVGNHLWQATIFAVAAFIIVLLLRRAPAQARHLVWLAASLKFALPSVLIAYLAFGVAQFFSPLFNSENQRAQPFSTVTQYAGAIFQPIETANVGRAVEPTSAAHNEIYCLLALIWFGGFSALLVRWLARRRRFVRAIERGRAVTDGREREALERAGMRLGSKQRVELKISPAVNEPGLWGVWRRIVVLPEGVASRLSDAELEAVMLHELLHAKRRDNLVGNLQMLLCCVLWFHPFVWLLNRRLRDERERACDEAAMKLCGETEVYAAGLLKVSRFCLGSTVAGASGANGSNLRRRLEYIMDRNANRRLRLWHAGALFAGALAFIVISFTAGSFDTNKATAQTRATASAGGGYGQARVHSPARRVNDQRSELDRRLVADVNADTDEDTIGIVELVGADDEQDTERVAAEVAQLPDTNVRFENKTDAPVTITNASMKALTGEQMRRAYGSNFNGETYASLPTVTLINNSSERLTRVALRFAVRGKEGGAILERAALIEPQSPYVFKTVWRKINAMLKAAPEEIVVTLESVQYESGKGWGIPAPPPSPPSPPVPPSPPSPPTPDSDDQ